MKNIIYIAAPNAGKGTVSDYLIKNYNYKHLSTGDLLRKEINSGSEFGREIEKTITSGKLMSDDVMIRLVEEELKTLKDQAFILDGFPRTLPQVKSLDEMLVTLGVTNNVVISLDIDYDLALKRAIGRISCPNCGRSYNTYFEEMNPKKENICDDCGIELIKRSDDNGESFKVRFDTYLNNASSIKDYYKEKNLLKEIMVDNNLDRVLNDVVKEAKND